MAAAYPEVHFMPKTNWFAIQVRMGYEAAVANALKSKTSEVFLPVYATKRVRSNRLANTQVPLFPGYLFARFDLEDRTARIVTTPGVICIVSFSGKAASIEESEINSIRAVVASELRIEPWLRAKPGLPVQIICGPLAGITGMLTEVKNNHHLVISISLLQRFVAVKIDAAWAEPVNPVRISGAFT
jgi:transcription antitermination factor NusG